MPQSGGVRLGEKAPEFRNLLGADGKRYSLSDFSEAPVLAVVFSCNHCPYVQAYEDRMIALQKEYAAKGFQMVLLNSNEDRNYPEDSYEEMVKRAKAKGYPFPYLRDETQEVAKAYGATHTPHIFLFDRERRLRYTGRIDDNWQNPKAVKERYLRDAVEALLAGRDPSPAETHAIGCTIKWL